VQCRLTPSIPTGTFEEDKHIPLRWNLVMTAANRSRHRVGPLLRVLSVLATLPAVAVAQARPGSTTYQVFAYEPQAAQLCPGEQTVIKVGVLQLTTRSASQTPTSRAMPNRRCMDSSRTNRSVP
jgi:hypothetical protein